VSKDYKNTINLPKTEFAMKANLSAREPAILADWHARDRYAEIQKRTATREHAFILHDGPPYANGVIHIGHAVNKVLKDIVVKSKLMAGFRSPYVPGWDCHGLPIEIAVEKEFGKVGQKLDAAEFRQKCREYAAKQIDLQRADFHPPPWLVPLLRHSIVEGVSLPIPASVVAARQRLFRDAEERGQ